MHQGIWKSLGFDEESRTKVEKHYGVTVDQKKDVVIALVDTGLEPNHLCFRVENGPESHLKNWKDQRASSLPYSRKIIGMQNFVEKVSLQNIPTALHKLVQNTLISLDFEGHGTSCASLAAAEPHELEVLNNVSGLPNAIINGANPNARIVSYKYVSDIPTNLDDDYKRGKAEKLFEKIVQDHPDIVSISYVSKCSNDNILSDPFNRGGLLAVKSNITACNAAGNQGPDAYTTSPALAPWLISVGACKGGRFETEIQFENFEKNKSIVGFGSINKLETRFCDIVLWKSQRRTDIKRVELEPPLHPALLKNEIEMSYTSLRPVELARKVKGKLVLVDIRQDFSLSTLVKAGAEGIIIGCDDGCFNSYHVTATPAVINISYHDANDIVERYISFSGEGKSIRAKVHATIWLGGDIELCCQSSRGPNRIEKEILKPDICCFGDKILCAALWNDKRHYAKYTMLSGTSMACPIIAGCASYIKSIRTDWAPSRIKSAIMSTASHIKVKQLRDVLGIGAGCIKPVAAIDPGLSYDVSYNEYLRFLKGRGEDIKQFSYEDVGTPIAGRNLNLCSFSTELGDGTDEYIFERRLTNLCEYDCTYEAEIEQEKEFPLTEFISIEAKPSVLKFNGEGDVRAFQLVVKKKKPGVPCDEELEYARLVWTEVNGGKERRIHRVSSPIVLAYPMLAAGNPIFKRHKEAGTSKERERSPYQPGEDKPSEQPQKRQRREEPAC